MITRIFEDLSYLYPLWRDTCLGNTNSEEIEVSFLEQIFEHTNSPIKKIIDLGGGVGTHSKLLVQKGFDITLLDRSEKALQIVKEKYPSIKRVKQTFERISIEDTFDAGICMWSTLSYIQKVEGQRNFYNWLDKHIDKVIVLDQANFYRYLSNFTKTYVGENEKYKLKVLREWILNKNNLKATTYKYEIYNKESAKTEIITDAENEQYLTVEQLQNYLGSSWKLKHLLGDYDLNATFEKETSRRLITVFERV